MGPVKPDNPPYSYDLVPYESYSYPQSHPDHLAALGRLFGLNSFPVTSCRVLELGCASGGNLIPMAYRFPESTFVGLDLSIRELEIGRKTIQDLNLKNINLRHMDIMDVHDSFGRFDYIIAHGVYSWIQDRAQDRILSICNRNLAPNGMAYVSYNTYPGWHMRGMIRHMMLYHTRQFQEVKEKIRESRALIDFLANSIPGEKDHFALLLETELELIKRSGDSYIFHEHLEEKNSPVYFHQFVDRAEKHGLQYLAEAEFSSMLTSGFPKEVGETLEGISKDLVAAEQYMDFLRNRLFRQTILCHSELSLERTLVADNLEGLLISSRAAPESDPVDLTPGVKQTFRTETGAWTKSDFAVTKAALEVLRNAWPKAMTLDTLLKGAEQILEKDLPAFKIDPLKSKEALGEDILHCFAGNVTELHTCQADFVTIVSEKPTASPLALYQADHALPIVNQRHESIQIDTLSKELLKVMNGSRDVEAVLDCLIGKGLDGTFVLEKNGSPVSGEGNIRRTLETSIAGLIQNLANLALLVK
jgi:methyltransferase-like protein/ubiquinone/menaquinone biosynthesis C-methylase UbiE